MIMCDDGATQVIQHHRRTLVHNVVRHQDALHFMNILVIV